MNLETRESVNFYVNVLIPIYMTYNISIVCHIKF